MDTDGVPDDVFSLLPWDQRRAVRSLAVATEKALRFFVARDVISLEGPPNYVVHCEVSACSCPRILLLLSLLLIIIIVIRVQSHKIYLANNGNQCNTFKSNVDQCLKRVTTTSR